MYHALLFFHVLSAFFLAMAIVMYSAFVIGSPVNDFSGQQGPYSFKKLLRFD